MFYSGVVYADLWESLLSASCRCAGGHCWFVWLTSLPMTVSCACVSVSVRLYALTAGEQSVNDYHRVTNSSTLV